MVRLAIVRGLDEPVARAIQITGGLPPSNIEGQMKETFANKASDALASSIASTDTNATLNNGAAFPSGAGNAFRVLVDSELAICTRSGNTLTFLSRGAENTTAAAHGGGAVVTQVLTEGALQRWGMDNVPGWNTSPPFRLLDASGNALTSSSFTVVNASTSTITDDAAGSITIRKSTQANVEDLTAIVRAAPATPYSIVAAIAPLWPQGGSSQASAGIGFRESGTGKLVQLAIGSDLYGPELAVYAFTNPTTFNSSQLAIGRTTVMLGPAIWMKISDDGTSLTYSISRDGLTWIQLYTSARTSFMAGGPDQVFVGANNRNNGSFETLTSLLAYQE